MPGDTIAKSAVMIQGLVAMWVCPATYTAHYWMAESLREKQVIIAGFCDEFQPKSQTFANMLIAAMRRTTADQQTSPTSGTQHKHPTTNYCIPSNPIPSKTTNPSAFTENASRIRRADLFLQKRPTPTRS